MFRFGFSYVGLIYLLMLYIPNFLWAKHKPAGYSAQGENKLLGITERIGEVLCSFCVLVFRDFDLRGSIWTVWLAVSFLLMILYELYWVRYFRSGKTLSDFYRPLWGIPVPGASLPVAAFFFLGIYGSNSFLILASIILGIGHIGIHRWHEKQIKEADELSKKKDPASGKTKLFSRILKWTGISLLLLILSVPVVLIGIRNVRYAKHFRMIEKGIDEGSYVTLGGQEQYILLRGSDQTNPVIVFLHGGPAGPETFVNYSWVDDLVDDYTVVDWDQRGCGRTYLKNREIDPANDSASFAKALLDLDDLVEYSRKRFGQDKVILVGHSYGTILASCYIEQHPEKVEAYVGIAQVVSLDTNNRTLLQMTKEAGGSPKEMQKLEQEYQAYLKEPNTLNTLALRQAALPILQKTSESVPLADHSLWYGLTSPYMNMEDYVWFSKQQGSPESYIRLNQSLFDSLGDFDLYRISYHGVPVSYIFGSLDYICPVTTIEDYLRENGTSEQLHVVEGCGHNVQYTKPHEVSFLLKKILSEE